MYERHTKFCCFSRVRGADELTGAKNGEHAPSAHLRFLRVSAHPVWSGRLPTARGAEHAEQQGHVDKQEQKKPARGGRARLSAVRRVPRGRIPGRLQRRQRQLQRRVRSSWSRECCAYVWQAANISNIATVGPYVPCALLGTFCSTSSSHVPTLCRDACCRPLRARSGNARQRGASRSVALLRAFSPAAADWYSGTSFAHTQSVPSVRCPDPHGGCSPPPPPFSAPGAHGHPWSSRRSSRREARPLLGIGRFHARPARP